jgi:hypothetical protein
MTFSSQDRAQLTEIVYFSIVGNGNPFIRAQHRLGAAFQSMIERRRWPRPDARRRPDAASVGPAMGERVAHHRDSRRIDGLGHARVKNACYAAHG